MGSVPREWDAPGAVLHPTLVQAWAQLEQSLCMQTAAVMGLGALVCWSLPEGQKYLQGFSAPLQPQGRSPAVFMSLYTSLFPMTSAEFCHPTIIAGWCDGSSHPTLLVVTRKDAVDNFLPGVCFLHVYKDGMTELHSKGALGSAVLNSAAAIASPAPCRTQNLCSSALTKPHQLAACL